jgi:hypothetical protein
MRKDERKKLLFKYISLLAGELVGERSCRDEKAEVLSKLGVSPEQALKEGAKLVLESYDK